jgi:hypothetical protein
VDETVEPPSSTSTENELLVHAYLGSRKKETTVTEFAESSAGNGLTYPVFRKMLEDFLNKFYRACQPPAVDYLKIKGSQEVMSKLLFIGNS